MEPGSALFEQPTVMALGSALNASCTRNTALLFLHFSFFLFFSQIMTSPHKHEKFVRNFYLVRFFSSRCRHNIADRNREIRAFVTALSQHPPRTITPSLHRCRNVTPFHTFTKQKKKVYKRRISDSFFNHTLKHLVVGRTYSYSGEIYPISVQP